MIADFAFKERDEGGAGVALEEDDDGYQSPTFDYPSSGEETSAPPTMKKARPDARLATGKGVDKDVLEDDEQLALKLLRR